MARILAYDIETSGLNPKEDKICFIGLYSEPDGKYYVYEGTDAGLREAQSVIFKHDVLVSFNGTEFDDVFLRRRGVMLRGLRLDLLHISRPNMPPMYWGCRRLEYLGYKLKSYSLRSIAVALKLGGVKGDIDYGLFKQEAWTLEERAIIEEYLKTDLKLTYNLFKFLDNIYGALKDYLPESVTARYGYLTDTIGKLAYNVVVKVAGLSDGHVKTGAPVKLYGGHHILPKYVKVRGNIVGADFASAYSHAFIQGNLFSMNCKCCEADKKFLGNYCVKQQGPVELAIKKLFMDRINAKTIGNNNKQLALKLVINSVYGITGNPGFNAVYNPQAAADCTQLVRDWLRGAVAVAAVNGAVPLYGFTDAVYVLLPEYFNEKLFRLMLDEYVKMIKLELPFPSDSFAMPIEKRFKFMWFIRERNCYLWVDDKGVVGYRTTLFNENTSPLVLRLFNEHIAPRITADLDVSFTETEVKGWAIDMLKSDLSLATADYNVTNPEFYGSKTCLPFQIAQRYGAGRHALLPNFAGIGVGKAQGVKGRAGLRYCTVAEFEQGGFGFDLLDINRLLRPLEPFWEVADVPVFEGLKEEAVLEHE